MALIERANLRGKLSCLNSAAKAGQMGLAWLYKFHNSREEPSPRNLSGLIGHQGRAMVEVGRTLFAQVPENRAEYEQR